MFRPEEELKGLEVPSWEWSREWLPDVGELQRGGVGQGRATAADALMEQGLVWCCGKNPSWGKGCHCKIPPKSPEPPRSDLGGAGWDGLGRGGQGKELPPLPTPSKGNVPQDGSKDLALMAS